MNSPVPREQAIELERKLAQYSVLMDSLVHIPFTRQGVGVDAAAGTVPVIGDAAGLLLTGYALVQARKLGVPWRRLWPAVRLAGLDAVLGMVPVVGDVSDVFLRPSRKAVGIVRTHVREVHQIEQTLHVEHPFMYSWLSQRQQRSRFWRLPMVGWLWLHIPDFLGLALLLFITWSLISGGM